MTNIISFKNIYFKMFGRKNLSTVKKIQSIKIYYKSQVFTKTGSLYTSNCLQLHFCQLVFSLDVLPKTSNMSSYIWSVNSAPNEKTLEASDSQRNKSPDSQHPLGPLGERAEEERRDGVRGSSSGLD